MGEFKKALKKLKDGVEAVDKQLEGYSLDLAKVTSDMATACGRFSAGYEVAYVYLTEKYQAENKDIRQNLNDSLRDITIDKTLAGMIKEIEEARKTALNKRKQFEATRAVMKSTLAENDVSTKQVEALQTSLAKKKKKLIQTKDFKKKVAGYENTLAGVATAVQDYKTLITQSIQDALSMKYLETNVLTLDTTMDDFAIRAKGSELDQQIDDVRNGALAVAKKFRNSQKDFNVEMKLIQDWIAEADEMEASLEEDGEEI